MEELTLHQVAEELDVHYMTAYRYVRLGILPARKQGREWRVLRSDLDALSEGSADADGSDGAPWDERLYQRLTAGDGNGAWAVVEAALAAGAQPSEVLTEILPPAMRRIGELWSAGQLGVETEHTASALAVGVVGRLGARFNRRGISRGTVVMGTTAGDLHGLPLAIASEVTRQAGFDVIDLGPRVPPEAFARAAANANRLLAVGIGITAPERADELTETLAALRSAVDVPLVVGGRGVGKEEALDMGADHWGPDANALVSILEGLTV